MFFDVGGAAFDVDRVRADIAEREARIRRIEEYLRGPVRSDDPHVLGLRRRRYLSLNESR